MKKPNIVFILMDDMGWKDLSCYGSEFYETPNIDRLAKQGMLFTDAYAACPVCSPTRASIMTGKYPARVGVTNFIDWSGKNHPLRGKLIEAPYIRQLPLEEKNLATTLKNAGYHTWHVGKWHLGGDIYEPHNQGFEVNIGGSKYGHPANGYFSPWNLINLENAKDGKYLTDHLTEKAIDLIKNNDEQPFFLNLWYYAVHTPIQCKAEYEKYFKEKAEKMGLDKLPTFEDGGEFHTEDKQKANQRIKRRLVQSDPAYAAMIKSVDENVGKLLEVLDDYNLTDSTIVFFTSDNGGLATAEGSPTCNAPLQEGKGWMYEGGTREPLIVKWPDNVSPNSVCKTPTTSTDFYPTILEMCGLPLLPEQHCDGESIVPLLKETGTPKRDSIFWHYPHYGNQGGTPGTSVRSGDFKLLHFHEDNHMELYNLKEDISEQNDLSATMPEKVLELRNSLEIWKKDVGAILPQPNPDYHPRAL